MEQLESVQVNDLFPLERQALLQLLAHLDEEAWQSHTVCAGWSVKDIALHLLGDDINILSRKRDDFDPPYAANTDHNLGSWKGLVAFLNEINELWVQASRRISNRLLCSFLEFTGEETQKYFLSLDPDAIGEAVSWAGPGPAPVWLDIAREYTERWMHQQQIRDAVGKPGLKERHYFAPVLEAFMRALPRTYRDIQADDGTSIVITVTGEAGGAWTLLRENGQWRLGKGAKAYTDAGIIIDQETCWRLFTKGISKDKALQRTKLQGDRSLGLIALDTVSIFA